MTAPQIVGADGQPARRPTSSLCPGCQAPESKRVASGGFGSQHDVCSVCGHEFEELTR